MTRLYFVRHGRAAAGWNVDPDPALDDVGRQQSHEVAKILARITPGAIFTSPLRRCQETSQPLAALWNLVAQIEPTVAEIPSPEGIALCDRIDWLRPAMAGTWSELIAANGPRYSTYRDGLLSAVATISHDAVVFSHFIAINVVIGAALRDDRVVVASLDNCSVTIVDVVDGVFTINQIGNESDTLIR